jgi:hypothetical protein
MFFLIEFSCNLICRPPPGRRERSSTILPNHTAADRTGGSQVQLQAQPDLFPQAEHPTVPDYIQAEVFLETLGFFTPSSRGSALHVMLFLENISQALFIFNGLRSHHCQRALLGYHYPKIEWFVRTDGTVGLGMLDATTGRYQEVDLDDMRLWRRPMTDLGNQSWFPPTERPSTGRTLGRFSGNPLRWLRC